MAKDFGGGGRGPATTDDAAGAADAPAARSGIPPLPSARPRGEPVPPPLGDDGVAAPRRTARTMAAGDGEVRERRRRGEAPARAEPPAETGSRFGALKLPSGLARMTPGRRLWFGLSFVAPVVLGAAYLFLLAPDEYVTEYRFSVRVPVGQSGSGAMGNVSLSALFGGNPTPGTALLDNFTVADYVDSAQAARDMNAKLNLRDLFNKPSDPFSRVGKNASTEKLERYWQKMVYANYDAASGLALVRVKAYTAQDSYALATNLVTLSSDLVNSIGVRSQQDTVRFAQAQVDRANARVQQLRSQLETFRRSAGAINPADGMTNGNEALINKLIERDSQLKAQYVALQAELRTTNAPQLNLLRQQIGANQAQLAAARGVVGGSGRLAGQVGQYENIQAQLKDAQAVLTATNNVLAQAQAVADSQRLYLTTYVKPTLPESPQAPDRWLDLLVVTFVSAMVWIIGRLIGNSIMEHG